MDFFLDSKWKKKKMVIILFKNLQCYIKSQLPVLLEVE